jgi:hypothetical protein
MRHEPTERALRELLRDPSTAGAVLFLTPDVRDSRYVRDVEMAEILRRHGRGDGFWLVPVAAGGLSYSDAPGVLAGTASGDDLARWNILKADDPFTPLAAAQVSVAALRERVNALHTALPPDAPVRIRLDVWGAGAGDDTDLFLDWAPHFSPLAKPAVWRETLLPALREVRDALRLQAPGRSLMLGGWPSLPAAFAIGHTFPETLGRPVQWLQKVAGGEEGWSLSAAGDATLAREHGWKATLTDQDINGRRLAVLVNVTNDTSSSLATVRETLPPMRAKITVDHVHATEVSPEDRPDLTIGGGAEAASLARLIRRTIRNALDLYGPLEAVHVFLAGPAGLAFLVGQLTNTLPAVVTYDALHPTGGYSEAATLPSAADR